MLTGWLADGARSELLFVFTERPFELEQANTESFANEKSKLVQNQSSTRATETNSTVEYIFFSPLIKHHFRIYCCSLSQEHILKSEMI